MVRLLWTLCHDVATTCALAGINWQAFRCKPCSISRSLRGSNRHQLHSLLCMGRARHAEPRAKLMHGNHHHLPLSPGIPPTHPPTHTQTHTKRNHRLHEDSRGSRMAAEWTQICGPCVHLGRLRCGQYLRLCLSCGLSCRHSLRDGQLADLCAGPDLSCSSAQPLPSQLRTCAVSSCLLLLVVLF